MVEDRLLRDLQHEMNKLAHDALKATLPDHATYARTAGMYQGLMKAQQLLEKHMRGDDEDRK